MTDSGHRSIRKLKCLALLLGVFFLSAASFAETSPMPPLSGKTLLGDRVSLPNGRPVALIFGFSRKAKPEAVAWVAHLEAEMLRRPDLGYYQVAVLAGAPNVLHAFIAGAIRREVPPAYRSHFLLVPDGAAWRRVLQVRHDNTAYGALCSGDGRILWQTEGADEAKFQAFDTALARMIPEPDRAPKEKSPSQ